MKRSLLITVFILLSPSFLSAQAKKQETRCGWFSNPTPANISLYDSEGDWIIGVQGGYQVEGDWAWPNFGKQWIRTNGHYGYGCACLNLQVDKKTGHVLSIRSTQMKLLKTCRQDQALKKWSELLK